MKLNREELLRQKTLLQEHLRWIEAKIAECDEETPAAPPHHEAPDPPVSPLAEIPPPPAPIKKQAPIPKAATPSSAGEADQILSQYRESSLSPRQAQFGCIAIAVLLGAIGLFIFLGLPYLLK